MSNSAKDWDIPIVFCPNANCHKPLAFGKRASDRRRMKAFIASELSDEPYQVCPKCHTRYIIVNNDKTSPVKEVS